jgi:hypothetical protein
LISAVLSNLHLGMRSCVLHAGPARRRLLAELEDVDQVVLLNWLGGYVRVEEEGPPALRNALDPARTVEGMA